VIGEEHRGLSGRIAAADDCDFLARAQLCFQQLLYCLSNDRSTGEADGDWAGELQRLSGV
jgi:hypothetical protein